MFARNLAETHKVHLWFTVNEMSNFRTNNNHCVADPFDPLYIKQISCCRAKQRRKTAFTYLLYNLNSPL